MVKVSIITSVLNAYVTIRDCIESVKSQSQSIEHIIIDGGSTDGTLDIIEEYRSSLTKVVSEPDGGTYHGMNRGILMATGDIIGILNADDLYAGPDILSKVVEAFSTENIDSCYGDLVYVEPVNIDRIIRYWRSGSYNCRRFYWGWMPPHPTFFVRRKVYKRYGLFNPDLGSAADYELILRLLFKHKISTTYIPEIIVKMRTCGMSNASLRDRLRANVNDRLAWKHNGLRPYPWTLFLKPLSKVSQYVCRP